MLLECHLALIFELRQQHQDRIINSIMHCRGDEVLIKWAGLGYDELSWERQMSPMPDITVQLAALHRRRPIVEVRCSCKCLILWLPCLQPHTRWNAASPATGIHWPCCTQSETPAELYQMPCAAWSTAAHSGMHCPDIAWLP